MAPQQHAVTPIVTPSRKSCQNRVFDQDKAASRLFARSLPCTVEALPADRRPRSQLTVGHVDGTSQQADHEQAIADLHAPAGGGWSMMWERWSPEATCHHEL